MFSTAKSSARTKFNRGFSLKKIYLLKAVGRLATLLKRDPDTGVFL